MRRRAALNMRNASGNSTMTRRGDAEPHVGRARVEEDVEPGVAAQQRAGDDQAGDDDLAAAPERPAGRGEREQQDEVEPDPGALPVLGVEGAVQGEAEHDDPADEHGAGDDRHEDAKAAAPRQVDPQQGVRVVDGGERVRQLAPLARAHLPQVCLVDHDLVRSQPTRWSHPRRSLDVVDAELVYAHAGFGSDAVDYVQGWDAQRAVHARRVSGEVPDSCLLLEHMPVYTAGKRTAVSDRPFGDPGAPVIDVDRGGKITWHGPGQLTAYPIIKLSEPVDVVAYVRALEESMIRVCAEFGLQRDPGRGALRRVDPGLARARAARPEGRGDRRPGRARGHHARARAELRLRPVVVRPDRALRHPGRGRDIAHGGDRHPRSRSPT